MDLESIFAIIRCLVGLDGLGIRGVGCGVFVSSDCFDGIGRRGYLLSYLGLGGGR